MSSNADFDWKENEEVVVLHEQPKTAIYANPQGAIVIRQQAAWDSDEDCYVVIQPDNVRLVALSLIAILGMSSDTLPPEQRVTPEERVTRTPAALRQKRYRERHTVTPESVTHRDEQVTAHG